MNEATHANAGGGGNTTWPELNGLPEYQRVRKYLEQFSRRYLQDQTGLPDVNDLEYSMFSWFGIHRKGEMHGPHTHVGEYHVGVYYARVGPEGGVLRMQDPRGHSPPFGREIIIKVKSGQVVLFPSWMSHMATLSGESSDGKPRVAMAFNIGPRSGAATPHHWFMDPVSRIVLKKEEPLGNLDEKYHITDFNERKSRSHKMQEMKKAKDLARKAWTYPEDAYGFLTEPVIIG